MKPVRSDLVAIASGAFRGNQTTRPRRPTLRFEKHERDSLGQGGNLVMRISLWIAAVIVFGGLAFWGRWFLHRRAWSRSNQDEDMRRHVSKNYD